MKTFSRFEAMQVTQLDGVLELTASWGGLSYIDSVKNKLLEILNSDFMMYEYEELSDTNTQALVWREINLPVKDMNERTAKIFTRILQELGISINGKLFGVGSRYRLLVQTVGNCVLVQDLPND